MKTRLYTLLIGLLMAVCITSYGQEIIGEFTHSNGLMNTKCQIVEAADGNLLVGFNVYHEDNIANFAVFKYTPEGELLDSLIFPDRSELWAANPLDPETQVYASLVTEDATTSVKITFIGSDFSVTDNLLVPIPNYDENSINLDGFFFDTQNDIIISYLNGNLLHFARIGLDGTLKDDKEIEGLYTPTNRPDTTVYYIRSRLFNTSPQQISLLGDVQLNYRWPLIGYFFDNDFNLIDKLYESGVTFQGEIVDTGTTIFDIILSIVRKVIPNPLTDQCRSVIVRYQRVLPLLNHACGIYLIGVDGLRGVVGIAVHDNLVRPGQQRCVERN